MINFSHKAKTVDLTAPGGGVVSGQFYKVGGFFGCAAHDAVAGDKFQLVRLGAFTVVKLGAGSGQAWAEGDTIYWDDTAKNFTKTTTSNTKVGLAEVAALTTDVVGTLVLVPNI